ncbi:MAG: ABC transporter substrate-binding protein [Oscillospiraceae bacterium]|nr:ABC transporter substrate-binding protein [Oscillospiraceae bacterium]
MKKSVALLLTLCLSVGLVGLAAASDTAPPPEAADRTTADGSKPLVVGTEALSQKFNPFFADTAYDMEIMDLVFGAFVDVDRQGNPILNGTGGEVRPYNGKDYTYYGQSDLAINFDKTANITTYTVKLRDDIKFSDGTPMTADDVVFTYYVLLDPAYVGSTTTSSYDIVGLKDYRTQTTGDIYAKYEAIAGAILSAGRDHAWAEGDTWTQAQQDAFWALADTRWAAACRAIVDYVLANYLNDEYAATIGVTAAEISASEGLQIAYGMAMWGFGEVGEGATVFTAKDGKTFDFAKGEYPTIQDYYDATFAAYGGDGEAFAATEHPDQDAGFVNGVARDEFIRAQAADEPELAGGIKNIAGIKKLDDRTVEITMNGFSAPAVYSVFGVQIAPKDYYGDGAYDYDANNFGHPFGDLSVVQAKTSAPMGAGPYKFVKYENKVAYLEANEQYYLGAPKIKYVQYKETLIADMVPGLASGAADVANPAFNKTTAESIKAYNANGQITGDAIQTSLVDNLGYGYIGLNADTVRVGSDSASKESKYLRTGLAIILTAQREVAINSYYGEAASIINYPISNTSWAAPQKTDPDYKTAFSTKLDGSPVYTAEMDEPAKAAAALAAAVEYFKAAGYTLDEASGKFTAAPDGAKLEYEVIIPGGGAGDHPSFGVLTEAKNVLATIGITLIINDPSDSNVLWDRLDAGTQELWCAAWQATPDPDMYQTYHSSGIVGRGGSDSNHYHIDDADLDQLIVDARVSDDPAYRKAVYKSALDKIIDWAVEIPVYQRQNCIIFSSGRINLDTLTQDITTFYKWYKEIEQLEMK